MNHATSYDISMSKDRVKNVYIHNETILIIYKDLECKLWSANKHKGNKKVVNNTNKLSVIIILIGIGLFSNNIMFEFYESNTMITGCLYDY